MPDENTILTENNDTEVGQEAENQEAVGTEEKSAEEKIEGQYKEDESEAKEDEQEEKEESGDEPKEYGDFTLPEGVQADEEVMGSFKDIAKEAGLKQEDAQKLVDLAADMMQKQADSIYESHKKAVEDWGKQAEADEELKGNFKENVGLAKKALDQFGSKELTEFLNETGAGNHPEVIKAFYRIGKAISEDKFIEGKRGDPLEGMTA